MKFSTAPAGREEEIAALFAATFAASEGEEEGTLIGALARRLLTGTPERDRVVFVAEEAGRIVGGIVFSRIVFAHDTRSVFLLAPVAVATDRQGRGIGQGLLKHGLAELRAAGIDIAMTYGDPNYYGRVGFAPVGEAEAPAPFPLTQPEGWLWQSLTDRPPMPLRGPSRCVAALDDPAYW